MRLSDPPTICWLSICYCHKRHGSCNKLKPCTLSHSLTLLRKASEMS